MYAKKSVSMKVVVLLLAVVLLIGCVAGGTIAYLMASTGPVTNTFVVGAIGELNLDETDKTSQNAEGEYVIIPGKEITKDPVVTFEGYNVPAYVFLKVDADGWNVTGSDTTYTYTLGEAGKQMSWTLEGWTLLEAGVYYKEVEADAGAQNWHIIKNDTITVSSDITKDIIGTYAKGLTFTAYAIQQDTLADAAAAWAVAKNAQ